MNPRLTPGEAGGWRACLDALTALLGPEAISAVETDRTAYARDLWPRTLIALQAGEAAPTPPEAVVWPRTTAEVAEIISICGAHGVPVVPFGAGSGVCGGVLALRGGVALDLKRMKAIRAVDAARGTVEVEAGIIGQHLEDALGRAGLTLGHFPSSIWCSTVGGWLATRSAGQCSTRYGKIEDMCVSLEVVTGDGVVRHTAPMGLPGAGPVDFNRLFIGSEGTLGVITAATLRVRPAPRSRRFLGATLPDLRTALEVMRAILQAGHPPAVLRLYDPFDSFFAGHDGGGESRKSGALGQLRHTLLGKSAARDKIMSAVLRRPGPLNAMGGLARKCTLVAVSEGVDEGEATRAHDIVEEAVRHAGGHVIGPGPAEAWLAHRHDTGFKMSEVYASGAFSDTFEVATTWANLRRLYAAVRKAISPYALVMAHFSHAYAGGCSIYFTFVGAGVDAEDNRRRYDAVWAAALEATESAGAAITHHHGVGLARSVALQRTHGEAWRWFRAFKEVLDPNGILNPGKLFDATTTRWEEA